MTNPIYPVGFGSQSGRRMTKLAFRNRFTAAEKAAIELNAMHDPTSTVEMQLRSASLRAFLADLAAASYIEPDRENLRAAMDILEQWGILSPGRVTSILDTPILTIELPEKI